MVIYSEKQSLDSQKVIHEEIQASAKTAQRTPKGCSAQNRATLKKKNLSHHVHFEYSYLSSIVTSLHTPQNCPQAQKVQILLISPRIYLFLFHQRPRVTFQRKSVHPVWSLFTPIRHRRPCYSRAPLHRQSKEEAVIKMYKSVFCILGWVPENRNEGIGTLHNTGAGQVLENCPPRSS